MADPAAPIPAKTKTASWRDVLPIHPAADLFPLMTAAELKALGEDIMKNGLRNPVVLIEDQHGDVKLLDGRNRLDALELIGEEITLDNSMIFERTDCDDPYARTVSLNFHRRHLTAKQKRNVIVKLLKAAPGKSNRQIAKQTKVDHKTVGAARAKLEARGEIPHVEKVADTKGRTQPVKKKRRDADDFARDMRAKKKAKAEADVVEINGFHRELLGFLDGFSRRFIAWRDSHPLIDGKPAINGEGKAALMSAFYLVSDGLAHLSQSLDGR